MCKRRQQLDSGIKSLLHPPLLFLLYHITLYYFPQTQKKTKMKKALRAGRVLKENMDLARFPAPTTPLFPRARRRRVRVVWVGRSPACRAGTAGGERFSTFSPWVLSGVTHGCTCIHCSKSFHKLKTRSEKNASAAKDEQRGGDGREPRPHSRQR